MTEESIKELIDLAWEAGTMRAGVTAVARYAVAHAERLGLARAADHDPGDEDQTESRIEDLANHTASLERHRAGHDEWLHRLERRIALLEAAELARIRGVPRPRPAAPAEDGR